MVLAITAGDPAGIAMAYDGYAAALYGYCHWMLHDSADAAESLQDTFVLAATTLSDRPEPLRPWLFALARNECRRRIRPRSATRDEADAANQRADGGQRADEVGRPTDATVQFRVVSEPTDESTDATVQFRMVSEPTDESTDATVQFRMVSEPINESTDATMPFRMISQLTDATVQFRVFSEPTDATDGLADVNGYLGQAESRCRRRGRAESRALARSDGSGAHAGGETYGVHRGFGLGLADDDARAKDPLLAQKAREMGHPFSGLLTSI